jgi:hypothetical protein
MSRGIQLTRRRPDTARRVFVSTDQNQENGNPLHPPIGGMGGSLFFPVSRVERNHDEKQHDSSSHIVESEHNNLAVEEQALSMSKADRQALLDRLALSLQESEQDRDSGLWVVAVKTALQARLGAEGLSAYGPAVLKPHIATSRNFKPVADFIKLAGLCELSVPERQAALNYLAKMVVDDAVTFASYAKIPLGPKMVGQRQANVCGIFDQQFPTYLASGLAKIVFKRLATIQDWDGDRVWA